MLAAQLPAAGPHARMWTHHNSGVQSLVTVLEILHCRSVGMYDTARLTVARANSLTTHGFAGVHYC